MQFCAKRFSASFLATFTLRLLLKSAYFYCVALKLRCILNIFFSMMSHYVGLAARLWLNCRYNPSKLTTLANSKTSTTLPSPPDALATPPPSPSPPLSSSPPPSERAQRKSSSAGASARPSSAAAIAAAAANACVSHSAKIDNEKKRSSQTSARRPPPQIAEMANYFRVPHPIWWLTILPALALNFVSFISSNINKKTCLLFADCLL